MHEPRGLVARLIQPAPENGVGVQGNSLSQVSRMKRAYAREDARVRLTIKLDEPPWAASDSILAWLMQETPNTFDSVAIGGVTAAVCIFPAHRATSATLV
jgi:hypothetical protein